MKTFSCYHKTDIGTWTDHIAEHQNKMFQSDDSAIEIRRNFVILSIKHFNGYIKTYYS